MASTIDLLLLSLSQESSKPSLLFKVRDRLSREASKQSNCPIKKQLYICPMIATVVVFVLAAIQVLAVVTSCYDVKTRNLRAAGHGGLARAICSNSQDN